MLIAHEFAIRNREGTRLPVDELHAEGERLMEALLDLEECNDDVSDPSTSSDAGRGTVTAEIVVTAEDEVQALAKSLHVVRTAIHAIGGCTPNWEAPQERRASYSPGPVQMEHLVEA